MRQIALGLSAFAALAFVAGASWAGEDPNVQITQLRAELEMQDFHDSVMHDGPLAVGVPVTLTFRNDAKVTVTPVEISPTTIKLATELARPSGRVLYDATFFTHYNVDADLSEKNPKGDLVYRLKLDPQVQQQ